ncbi:DEAD/DEAH box helicase [Gracilibacillus marinus]|uniref:DEAD/DEAH box helicase n=1 Tax=Gracilibacillus marinus TaxID=630535 RepID=A0ABV8VTG6_9BACI
MDEKFLAGKLLLRQEIPLTTQQLEQLIDSKKIVTIEAITQTLFRYRCNRCMTTKRHHFASIPCKRCMHEHVYCRNCIRTGRVLACETLYYWKREAISWPEQLHPCEWTGSLTKHQQHAAEVINCTLQAKKKELICWAVCGAGKTEMLFPAITTVLQQGMRICLATPRADVVRELAPRFRQAFPHTEIEALYGGTEERTGIAQLVLATTHQLIRYKHAFDCIIIDEIDSFPYHKDDSLHQLAKRAMKDEASAIYLTATPRPKEKRRIQTKELPVVFVPIRFHGFPLPVPELILDRKLHKNLQKSKAPQSFEHYLETRYRRFLLFVSTIDQLPKVKKMISTFNITSETVHAEDPKRKELVDQFRENKFDCLITTTILERGVTFPSIDVIVFDAGHQVFDEAALVQIAGRAGRSPDDPNGHVLFFHQGKTNAMVQAIEQITTMNKKGREL